MQINAIVLLVATSMLAWGCSPLAPQPDRSQFFVLTPISNDVVPAASQNLSSQPLTIGIGPVDFPDYLRRLEVVTRDSPNELFLSSERRWGEPLDRNFSRILAENLSQLLGTQQIERYPWPKKVEVDYQVVVDVVRFETTTDGHSESVVRWTIKDGRSGKVLAASETRASTPVGKVATGASAALSADLGSMSREIAAKIESLNAVRPSPSPHEVSSAGQQP